MPLDHILSQSNFGDDTGPKSVTDSYHTVLQPTLTCPEYFVRFI